MNRHRDHRSERRLGLTALLFAALLSIAAPAIAAPAATPPAPTAEQQKIAELEQRIAELEADPKASIEAQNRLIDKSYEMLRDRMGDFETQVNTYIGLLGFLFAILSFVGWKTIGGWIESQIEKKAKDKIDAWLTDERIKEMLQHQIKTFEVQLLEEFRIKAELELDEIRKLKALYKYLPPSPASSMTPKQIEAVNAVDAAAEKKPEEKRNADEWFAIALKAYKANEFQSAYDSFIRAMKLNESGRIVGAVALAAERLGNLDEAEKYYCRAIEIDSKNAVVLGNFANYMKNHRNDNDKAEALYRQAIEAVPNHAIHLGNFANFLRNVRGNYKEAEQYYRRAIEADPKLTEHIGNFAQMLLAQGSLEGEVRLESAFALAPTDMDLLSELWLYRFAHFPQKHPESLGELKKLIVDGARSKGWNFAPTIERAKVEGHPDPALLQALADVIAKDAPIETLDAFEQWRQA